MSYRRRNVEMLAQQASSPYPEFLSFNMIGFFNTKAQKVFSELYCSIDVPLLTTFLKQSSDPSFHFRKTWNQYCTSACKSRENMTTIQDGTTNAQTVSAVIFMHIFSKTTVHFARLIAITITWLDGALEDRHRWDTGCTFCTCSPFFPHYLQRLKDWDLLQPVIGEIWQVAL